MPLVDFAEEVSWFDMEIFAAPKSEPNLYSMWSACCPYSVHMATLPLYSSAPVLLLLQHKISDNDSDHGGCSGYLAPTKDAQELRFDHQGLPLQLSGRHR